MARLSFTPARPVAHAKYWQAFFKVALKKILFFFCASIWYFKFTQLAFTNRAALLSSAHTYRLLIVKDLSFSPAALVYSTEPARLQSVLFAAPKRAYYAAFEAFGQQFNQHFFISATRLFQLLARHFCWLLCRSITTFASCHLPRFSAGAEL